jgi:hypothetical protein
LNARRCAAQRGLPMKIRAPHKGEFALDVIEQPIALFQTLDGNFFHLRNCVEVQLQANTPPALLMQGQDILNRLALLLPARIREGFCNGPLGKIECIGKTERHKVAGQTSEISDPFVKKWFHFAWDIDRVPYCFHRKFLLRLIDFVKKLRIPSGSRSFRSAQTRDSASFPFDRRQTAPLQNTLRASKSQIGLRLMSPVS